MRRPAALAPPTLRNRRHKLDRPARGPLILREDHIHGLLEQHVHILPAARPPAHREHQLGPSTMVLRAREDNEDPDLAPRVERAAVREVQVQVARRRERVPLRSGWRREIKDGRGLPHERGEQARPLLPPRVVVPERGQAVLADPDNDLVQDPSLAVRAPVVHAFVPVRLRAEVRGGWRGDRGEDVERGGERLVVARLGLLVRVRASGWGRAVERDGTDSAARATRG